MGYSRKNGEVSYNIQTSARKLGPPFKSKEFARVKNKHCSIITEDQRIEIFKNLYKKMNWDQRKVFVINHVRMSTPKTTYTNTENSRRKYTL